MAVALATRLVMLKKPATLAMSQMSRSENPTSRSACRSALLDGGAGGGHQRGEIQHRPLPRIQRRHAIVHHQHLAQHRIARQLPHRRAMSDQAIEAALIDETTTAIISRSSLLSPLSASIRSLYMRGEGVQLVDVEGVGLQHVRHHAQLLGADVEVFLRRLGQRIDHRQIEGGGSVCVRSRRVRLLGQGAIVILSHNRHPEGSVERVGAGVGAGADDGKRPRTLVRRPRARRRASSSRRCPRGAGAAGSRARGPWRCRRGWRRSPPRPACPGAAPAGRSWGRARGP